MYGSNFSNSDLSGGEFYLVLAFDASFAGTNLRNVKFMGGSYKDADFTGADLDGALFSEDNIGGAVDLSGANFSNAKLDRAEFKSALYDASTKFPSGFSLDRKGLSRIS